MVFEKSTSLVRGKQQRKNVPKKALVDNREHKEKHIEKQGTLLHYLISLNQKDIVDDL